MVRKRKETPHFTHHGIVPARNGKKTGGLWSIIRGYRNTNWTLNDYETNEATSPQKV